MSAKELLDKQFDWYDKSPTSGIKLYFECVVIEAMEEYATIKLQEQAKEIERLREGLIMAKNYASNTNVIDAIDKVLTNH